MKSFAIRLSTLLLLMLGTACQRSIVPVDITGNMKASGKTVQVYGSANLPEQSVLSVRLTNPSGDIIEEELVTIGKRGGFDATFSRSDSSKPAQIEVWFNPADQPEDVLDTFGEKGERISEETKGYNAPLTPDDEVSVRLSVPLEPLEQPMDASGLVSDQGELTAE